MDDFEFLVAGISSVNNLSGLAKIADVLQYSLFDYHPQHISKIGLFLNRFFEKFASRNLFPQVLNLIQTTTDPETAVRPDFGANNQIQTSKIVYFIFRCYKYKGYGGFDFAKILKEYNVILVENEFLENVTKIIYGIVLSTDDTQESTSPDEEDEFLTSSGKKVRFHSFEPEESNVGNSPVRNRNSQNAVFCGMLGILS